MLKKKAFILGLLALFIASFPSFGKDLPTLRLATGSPYELGLVGRLFDAFKKHSPCRLKVTKAGSGKSLKLLKSGKVDVVMVHAPYLELEAVREGWALDRTYIGANDFVIVGPKDDPAGIRSCEDVVCAYRKIAEKKAIFVSRGDNSGTHRKELHIWKMAGIEPKGSWYVVTHNFMMASLLKANRLGGYFMTDRSTYIVARKKHPELKLVILFEGDPVLINRYHALIGNPKVNPSVNYDLAKRFVEFLSGDEGQRIISTYGKDLFGSPLYFPRSRRFGRVIILHAGSLSVPLKRIEKLFEDTHEGVDVVRESHGSVKCARLISELGKPCDIVLSADVEVIKKILYPKFASWWVSFATNSMVLAYTKKSRGSQTIGPKNWYRVLSRKGVTFGHSDPNLDPCGYRTVILLKLASAYYGDRSILDLERKAILRPKSVELLGLLETGNLDYAFEYRSVAVQHHLLFLEFPREINLSDPSLNHVYSKAWVDIRGKRPGKRIRIYGKAITYAGTVLSNAPDKGFAREFMRFLLDKRWGLKVLSSCGQMPLSPPVFFPADAKRTELQLKE